MLPSKHRIANSARMSEVRLIEIVRKRFVARANGGHG
jgi:hypothetical protein